MPETKSADVRRVETYREWHGHLTLDNVQAVYERIVNLLGGDTLHSWVFLTSDYETSRRMPDVRTGLTADITLRHDEFEGTPYASIAISNGWHHSLMTEVADGVEARALPERRRPPWLKITHDRLEVSDHAPIGARTYTVYAVEQRDDPNAVEVDTGSAVVGGKVITETAAQPAGYVVGHDDGRFLLTADTFAALEAARDEATARGEGWAVYAAYPVGGGDRG